MTIDPEGEAPFKVAIVGAGITGISLAIGLQARNVPFAVYERARSFREVGAGIGLSENAERAMTAVAPSVREAFEKVAMPNGEDYFQWVDGFNTDRLIFRLHVGDNGFRGCRRSDFLEELIKVLPEGTVKWGKELRSIEEDSPDGRTTLVFKDGTDARADIVVGCDGIRSRVRQLLLGEQDPASHAGYTHKYCFRSLAPMDEALKAIGPYRASTRFMYNGPDAHIITYPVAEGSVLNIVVFVTDTNPWHPNSEGESNAENSGNNITTISTGGRNVTHTGKGSREGALSALEGWHPTARAIAGLLPTGDIEKWAVFDMLDHPAGSYARGTTCLAGDAAHAAGPHLGAGAGFGIEDAVFLATLIAQAADGVKADGPEGKGELGTRKNELASEALRVYSDVRYERTQWLIGATRDAVALFQWQKDDRGADHDRFAREITRLFHKIWHYDLDLEVKQARAKLAGRLT